MPPRPKKRKNQDLPKNLTAQQRVNGLYYQYKHPKTGRRHGFGYDKKKAVDAAIQLNSVLIPQNTLIDRVVAPTDPLSDYFVYYREQAMPSKRINGHPLARSTITERTRMIKHFINELGHHSWQQITQSTIKEYLNTLSTAEVFNKHRALLVLIWKEAISDGKTTDNLPERILKRDTEPTKRAPLSLEQYKLIWQHATPAIKNAMELSLNALQRRADIQKWKFSDEWNGFIHIVIQKTEKHGKSSFIEIPADMPVAFSMRKAKTLKDLIINCRDEHSFSCPFLVHEKRQRRVQSKEKEHTMQLSVKQISDGFKKAREAAGINTENPPTFHELLALGEKLKYDQGWTTKQIQTLRGHTSEKTTQNYLDRQIEWTTVEVPKTA